MSQQVRYFSVSFSGKLKKKSYLKKKEERKEMAPSLGELKKATDPNSNLNNVKACFSSKEMGLVRHQRRNGSVQSTQFRALKEALSSHCTRGLPD